VLCVCVFPCVCVEREEEGFCGGTVVGVGFGLGLGLELVAGSLGPKWPNNTISLLQYQPGVRVFAEKKRSSSRRPAAAGSTPPLTA
jgi:hypothetical protein